MGFVTGVEFLRNYTSHSRVMLLIFSLHMKECLTLVVCWKWFPGLIINSTSMVSCVEKIRWTPRLIVIFIYLCCCGLCLFVSAVTTQNLNMGFDGTIFLFSFLLASVHCSAP
jgi:hypothetical protein